MIDAVRGRIAIAFVVGACGRLGFDPGAAGTDPDGGLAGDAGDAATSGDGA